MHILKKSCIVSLLFVVGLTFTACGVEKSANRAEILSTAATSAVTENSSSAGEHKIAKENLLNMRVKVGDRIFTAKLYDNETSQALLERLPMTVNMTELHGQEKYYNLPENLPAKATEAPAIIHAGEIMRWSTNSLVLFYTTYSNSYNGYAQIGYIEDVDGLKEAVGKENIQVTFMKEE